MRQGCPEAATSSHDSFDFVRVEHLGLTYPYPKVTDCVLKTLRRSNRLDSDPPHALR